MPAVPLPPIPFPGREPPARESTHPADLALAQATGPRLDAAALAAEVAPAAPRGEQNGELALEAPAPEAAPPAGAPLAGALPFDLAAFERGVDRFFAQLADLREEWDGLGSPSRLLPWLTAATAAALVIARRRHAPAEPAAAPLLLPRGEP